MCSLMVGIHIPSNEYKLVEIEEVNLDSKIDNFKSIISDKTSLSKDTIELVYCGNIMEDDLTLSSYGLRPGVLVHVLKKNIKEIPVPSQTMSEQDIKALVIAFRTLTFNPSHRNSLQKLSHPDILENIIMITPGLSQDPVAIALIQDPELMVRLANVDTVRRIVQLHPALAEAANHIAATVHEEALHNHTTGPSTSSGYSLLDLISDDDDMESSQSSDSMQLAGVSRQPSFSITSAQVAAALASVRARESVGGTSSMTPPSSEPSGTAITPEMVSEAMQRAMASVGPAAGISTPPTNEPNNPSASNLREQMRQMRELGLTDDALNLQALQLSAGNVHAAVDLVFSGAINPDTTM